MPNNLRVAAVVYFSVVVTSLGQAPPAPTTGPAAGLSGSGWITAKGGQSELIRGLNVTVLPERVVSNDFADALAKHAAYSKTISDDLARDPANKEFADAFVDLSAGATRASVGLKATIPASTFVEIHEALRKTRREIVDRAALEVGKRRLQFRPFDADRLEINVRFLRDTEGEHNSLLTPLSIGKWAIAKSVSGADGKFSISPLPAEARTLFAWHDTDGARLVWCLPIADLGSSVDLSNANAAIVWNKRLISPSPR